MVGRELGYPAFDGVALHPRQAVPRHVRDSFPVPAYWLDQYDSNRNSNNGNSHTSSSNACTHVYPIRAASINVQSLGRGAARTAADDRLNQ